MGALGEKSVALVPLNSSRLLTNATASAPHDAEGAEKALARVEAILTTLTPKERAHPELLNASRKRRVAAGAGVKVEDVNKVLRQFEQIVTLTKQLGGMTKGGKRRGPIRFPF